MIQKQKDELATEQVNYILQLNQGLIEEKQKKYIELISLANKLEQKRANSVYKQPYTVNIFEHYNSTEPITSWALAEILKYNEDGDFILLKLFVKSFLSEIDFNVSSIKHPTITAEKEGRIDVLIQEANSYAIIIENKIKGADYQRNQLARYIEKLQERGYKDKQIFIVLLPKWCSSKLEYVNNLRPSIWCLPSDYTSNNGDRLCGYCDDKQCWCDDKNHILKTDEKEHCKRRIKNYRQTFESHTVIIHKEITEWLINECMNIIPKSEIILKSIIIQFSDFLNAIYNNRDNKKLTEEMEQYLREKLLDSNDSAINSWRKVNQKIEEIDNLKKEMENLRTSVSCDVIDEWRKQLKQEWFFDLLRYEPRKSFGVLIQGVWCGCWCGTENGGKPYWGFYIEDASDLERKEQMVKDILDSAGMSEYGKYSPIWIRWCGTLDGANECTNLYNAAKKLGYLNAEKTHDLFIK